MPRRQWSDLSERTRRLLIIAAVADGILRVAALIDIKGRPGKPRPMGLCSTIQIDLLSLARKAQEVAHFLCLIWQQRARLRASCSLSACLYRLSG